MTCVLLAAGHNPRLDADILRQCVHPHALEAPATAAFLAPLVGVPKALLPARRTAVFPTRQKSEDAIDKGDAPHPCDTSPLSPSRGGADVCGGCILDLWMGVVRQAPGIKEVFVVTNASRYKHIERWATSTGFPVDNVINDGTTTLENSAGSVADVALALRTRQSRIIEPVVVVAADMAQTEEGVDLQAILSAFESTGCDLVACDVVTRASFNSADIVVAASARVGGSALLFPPTRLVHGGAVADWKALCGARGIVWTTEDKTVVALAEKPGTALSFSAAEVSAAMQATGEVGGDGFVGSTVALYVLSSQTAGALLRFAASSRSGEARPDSPIPQPTHSTKSLGDFFASHLQLPLDQRRPMRALQLTSAFHLVGSATTLAEFAAYLFGAPEHRDEAQSRPTSRWLERIITADPEVWAAAAITPHMAFTAARQTHLAHPARVVSRCYARVGLMGNPSDGMHGKSLAVTVANFWAEVAIAPSATVLLLPHPLNDPTQFRNLRDLFLISTKEGYAGGLRLLQATCKVFFEYCSKNGITLSTRNFSLSYDTNIPRQVGLAGSSCIVAAAFKALMAFYGLVSDVDIPKAIIPSIVLSVETDELGIHAGLQDRVAQVYEGCMYMDFDKAFLEAHGHAIYRRVDVQTLPSLYLAVAMDPSDSGRIHNDVKQRWKAADPAVLAAVVEWRSLVDAAVVALERGDREAIADLMDRNCDVRREIYGDQCLGKKNLRMVAIAREHGAGAKFPGSGGAILVCPRKRTDLAALREAYEAECFVFVRLTYYSPQSS